MAIDKQIEWSDISGTDDQAGHGIEWIQRGENSVLLEGRVLGYEQDKINVSLLGLSKRGVTFERYDSRSYTYEIFATTRKGVCAGLPEHRVQIPREIRIILVSLEKPQFAATARCIDI